MEKDNKLLKKTLVNLLREEVVCARALFQSLKSERKALSSLDEKLITINSASKQKLITALQSASDARISLVDKHGITSTAVAIKEQFVSSNSNTELNTLFIQLSELAHQCFDENRRIGQLINRRAQFISQALSSLSPSANVQNLTYGETGSIINTGDTHKSPFYLAKI